MTALTNEDIRIKNRPLLMTSHIIDSDITDARVEAFQTVQERLEGFYDLSSYSADEMPSAIALYTKNIAAGNLIISNYPDNQDAIKVGEMLRNEAFTNIKAIIDRQKRLNIPLSTNESELKFSYTPDCVETHVNDFIDSARQRYR